MHTVPADLRARGATVEVVVGSSWWAVGSSALPAGPGTLVLAAGLVVAGALVRAGQRNPAYREPLPADARRVLPLAVVCGLALVVGVVLGAGAVGLGEFATPGAAVVLGCCYLWAASRLARRVELLLGLALLALGTAGVLSALGSAGELHSRGLVGFSGGVLFWVAAALRVGLHRRLLAGLGR
ncbi:MAG: hypothetical protein ACT4O0_14270 [Pseudonocardia sp.]